MGLIFLFFVIYSSVMGTGKEGMHAFLRSPFYQEFSLLKGLCVVGALFYQVQRGRLGLRH